MQKEVENLRKELAKSETLFQVNVNNAATSLKFTRAELEGVPDSLLTRLKTGEDEYVLDANVTFQVAQVLDNAVNENTRKRLYIARDNRARAKNSELLKRFSSLGPISRIDSDTAPGQTIRPKPGWPRKAKPPLPSSKN